MSVAKDAVTNNGMVTQAPPFSFNHTVSGANRMLIVFLSINNEAASGVTYNGVAMTQIARQQADTDTHYLEAWKLVNPATGTNSVQVTLGSSQECGAVAYSCTGVDQTTPVGTSVADQYIASGASHAHDTTSKTDGLVLDGFLQNISATITTNGGQTTEAGPTIGTGTEYVVSSKPGAATVNTGYSWTGADFGRWAHITVPLNPSTGTHTLGSSLRPNAFAPGLAR